MDTRSVVENIVKKMYSSPQKLFGLMKKHFANFSHDLAEIDRGEPEKPESEIPAGTEPVDQKQEDQESEIREVGAKDETVTAAAVPPKQAFFDLNQDNMLMAVMLQELLGKPVALRDDKDTKK